MEANKKVLIIDDDLDFQLMISSLLNKSGYDVRSLFEGKIKEASEMAKSSDVVLLDIELPGVSGVDVGKRLKADPATTNVPIIMVSAHPEGDKLFIESNANAFIPKPFLLSRLLKEIKEMLAACHV
jgi:CheY-like chemotaxis protein